MLLLDILVVFRLDLSQISFNLVENTFATQQLALLATRIAFLDIWAQACAEINIFRLFDFWIDFYESVIYCRWAIFTMEQPGVVAWNFAASFSLNFLSIFVHTCISGSIRPLTLIWASLQRSFPPAEVEDWWGQKWKKGQALSWPVTGGTGVNGLIFDRTHLKVARRLCTNTCEMFSILLAWMFCIHKLYSQVFFLV